MDTKYGFTRLAPSEFSSWLRNQSISRTCVRVQEHHTWKPRYSGFTGSNHFEMQRNMRRYHIDKNGWSDIGQHFSIFPDGMIVTGRSLNSSPACIARANSGALCLEHIGNFDQGGDTMRSEQADAIIHVTVELLKKIGISEPTKSNVVYHHWYNSNGDLVYYNSGQKTCPGTAFFGGNQLEDFQANFLPRLKAEFGGGGSAPVGLVRWAVVNTEQLNIRNTPSGSSSTSNVQGNLQYGAVIRVYETSANGWYKISQSRPLWIYGRFTKPVRPAIVNTPDTNIRIGPGIEHDIDQVIQTGDKVFVVAQEGNWLEIVGDLWVHASLLDFV